MREDWVFRKSTVTAGKAFPSPWTGWDKGEGCGERHEQEGMRRSEALYPFFECASYQEAWILKGQ